MKKKKRKLSLSRITVRALDTGTLDELKVAGGCTDCCSDGNGTGWYSCEDLECKTLQAFD